MKLSFIPADLHLDTTTDGTHRITLKGSEVFRCASGAKALRKFNEIKGQLQEEFPAHDLSNEEKKELLQKAIGDALVKHTSLKPEIKKNRAKGTRTFG